ncbi:hypothetical protein VC83_06124 [Pseudogymnoascus destructans]|uniref:C2H2-type domain-containing protein n=2 Tax=Pseudogymnoascus destructans TaxID=655981 RepID=L8FU38_PSED2|nr:uncharacterized protein VC83_06124 [Pseudogymnoascus destructans]ELR04044.1 hypothetical protein GMDG_06553 [Pseudogymnoascus destructans 20631-21]OAF58838.1 hypothetical protein VC83_06124 [Pseudogymnoascus destructans]
MDSNSAHRNTNNPPGFSRSSTSPLNWDQFSHDGPSDPGLFPMQMSYLSQPVAGDSIIVRTMGASFLDAAYNSVPSGIPGQRTLPKWHSTPTNPPQISVGVSSTIPYTHTLAFYVFNDEDPWSQKGFFAEPSTFDGRLHLKSQLVGQLPVNQNLYGKRFQTEGDAAAGVVLGKPQSDSGYGSLQSAYAPSISNFDTGLPATGNRIAYPHSHGFQQADATFGPEVASSKISRVVPPLLRCPTCNKAVRTPSVLRKHDLRHKKPFICSYPDCPGSGHGQGFGTVNDLDRHIRSKHPEGKVSGRPIQLFSCHFSECQEKGRKFTRSDNFGVHLDRCHGMEKDEIKGIIQRKKEQHWFGDPRIQLGDRPQEISADLQIQDASLEISFDHAMEQSNESLATDGSHYEMYDNDDQGHPEDISFYIMADQSRDLGDTATNILAETKYRPADTTDMEYLMDPTLDISKSATPVATTIGTTPKRENGSYIHGSTDSHAQKALASALANKRSQDRNFRGMGASQKPMSLREDPVDRRVNIGALFSRDKSNQQDFNSGDLVAAHSKDEDCYTDSQDDDNAATILRDMNSRGFVLQRKTALLPEPPAPSPSTQPRSPLSCSVCFKTCRRPSEMAKHMKRHSRPYHCTFPPCAKTFGSKNDWRRHENSQHLHYESWRCQLPSATTTTTATLQTQSQNRDRDHDKPSACKHISYHLDAFKSHLSRTHQIGSTELNDSATLARCLAPCPCTFHCGFCARRLPQRDWSARFDHFDGHFSGRGGAGKVEMAAWTEEGEGADG